MFYLQLDSFKCGKLHTAGGSVFGIQILVSFLSSTLTLLSQRILQALLQPFSHSRGSMSERNFNFRIQPHTPLINRDYG